MPVANHRKNYILEIYNIILHSNILIKIKYPQKVYLIIGTPHTMTLFDEKYFYVYVMWSKNYFACRGISSHIDFKKTFPQNVNYMTLLLLCVLSRQVLYLIRGSIIGSLFLLDLELNIN